jgi:hypothetical protein
MSDSVGRFSLLGVSAGEYVLLAQHPSYVTVRDSIEVRGGGLTELLVVLVPDPIAMDPIIARGITAPERRARAAASAHYIAVTRDDLREAERRGAARLSDLFWVNSNLRRWVRYDIAGGGVISGGACIQYPRPGPRTIRSETVGSGSGCRFPATYLNDTYLGPGALEGASILEQLSPSEIFSVELVPPTEAVYRFGRIAGNGALVITTLMGAAEAAARHASVEDLQRRHWTYLGFGAGAGVFGGVAYAYSQGLFEGGGTSFNSSVLPVVGIVALGIGIGELFFRRSGKDGSSPLPDAHSP